MINHKAYYDDIAKRWHETTGYKGGSFKELVLNDILLEKIPAIDNSEILELGAGNGYVFPLVLRRFSGQVPSRITVSDKSEKLLEIAKRHFKITGAQYQCLDVCKPLPFESNCFDLLIASMIFNEVSSYCFRNALKESHRVLKNNSLFLISVIHPDFVSSLEKRQLLNTNKSGVLTMPGTGNLQLPVVIRSLKNYHDDLMQAGFQFEQSEILPSKHVLNAKEGLRNAGNIPIALVFTCKKNGT